MIVITALKRFVINISPIFKNSVQFTHNFLHDSNSIYKQKQLKFNHLLFNDFPYKSKKRKMFKKKMLLPYISSSSLTFISDHHIIPKSLQKHHFFHNTGRNFNFDFHHEDNLIRMVNDKHTLAQLQKQPSVPLYFRNYGNNKNPEKTLFHSGGHRKYNKYVKQHLEIILFQAKSSDEVNYLFYLLFHHLKKNCYQGKNMYNLPWN